MRLTVTRRPEPARPPRRASVLVVLAAGGLAACLPLATASAAPAARAGARATAPVATARTSSSAGDHHYDADHMGSGIAARTAAAGRSGAAGRPDAPLVGGVLGMDVSGYQHNVNWTAAYAAGARFAVVKATEGTTYTNPYFTQQYDGSAAVGMVRGAYHFALPNTRPGSGTAQADFFVDHGGGWSADGATLPPALDIEYNPYGPTCYRMSPASVVAWIQAFVAEVHARTAQYPLIYSTYGWWSRCTGNSAAFSQDPLWIADYGVGPGRLPAGWAFQTLWQYADSGAFVGDQDSFNGSPARLQALVGRPATASPGPAPGLAVSATVPAHVVVGAATTTVPVTVTTAQAQTEVTVALRSVTTGRISATTTLSGPAPTTRFSGTVVLSTADIAAWGTQTWVVTTPDPTVVARIGAVLRAQSLLGMRATRSTTTVTVIGAARSYNTVLGRFGAWAGRPVTIQRWTSTGWRRLTTARTDSHGNIRVALHIPFTVGLRLVDPSSANTWGVSSTSQIL